MASLNLLAFTIHGFALGAPSNGTQQKCANSRYEKQPRAFICTDMSNEPDDQMSLVRLLTYANEINITGIAGVTSTWLNDTTDVATIRTVISAYGDVVDNLNSNLMAGAQKYPTSAEILQRVVEGWPVYGLAALSQETLSSGAQRLIQEADHSTSSKPLYVALWGGANVLAEALNHISRKRESLAIANFVASLRVYSISDQDDAGLWIRTQFPKLFYVVSLHGFSEYTQATWNGISGETFRHFDAGGPDSKIVSNEWLSTHIRIGPLGLHYPKYEFIMEGDTPSFFPLVQNGLGDAEHPEWGSWGGRYLLQDFSGRSYVYADTADFVVANNQTFLSKFATIWRWREAYQFDFAARMGWTTGSFAENNHAPVVVVNESCGPDPLNIQYKLNETIVLDAGESWDPDGDSLTFDWTYYRDVTERLEGKIPTVSPNVAIEMSKTQPGVAMITPKENTVSYS